MLWSRGKLTQSLEVGLAISAMNNIDVADATLFDTHGVAPEIDGAAFAYRTSTFPV